MSSEWRNTNWCGRLPFEFETELEERIKVARQDCDKEVLQILFTQWRRKRHYINEKWDLDYDEIGWNTRQHRFSNEKNE